MIFAGNDLTAENTNFIGLAKYDGETDFTSFSTKILGKPVVTKEHFCDG